MFTAVYHTSDNRYYQAEVFLTSVTLTIRFKDENGVTRDVIWLAKKFHSFTEENLTSSIIYENEEQRFGKLVIRDQRLTDQIKKLYSHIKVVGKGTGFLSSTRSRLLAFCFVLLSVLAGGYFLFIPWLGQKMADSVSKEWEHQLGSTMFASVKQDLAIDSLLSERMDMFYKATGYDAGYPVTVVVAKSDEVNAFAIPGGYIVVYSAILEKMDKPEQLAALLAHEVSHISLRHSLRSIFRSLAQQMFLMLILGNESGIAGYITSHADRLKTLQYSRTLETEADNNGLELMRKNGITTSGMLGLMVMLKESTGLSGQPVQFLNTHPVFEERINNIKALIIHDPESLENNSEIDAVFRLLKQQY